MRWSDIPFSPPDRTLRQFAGLWILFFGGWACAFRYAHQNTPVAVLLVDIAVLIGVPGLIRPRLLRPIWVAWMVLAFPIGWVVSLVLLGLVYFGLFTPIAWAFRLSGRDVLGLRPTPGRETYWQPKPAPADIRRYFRQF
jgi:hypothetical protein